MRGIHRCPVNSPHKGPVTRKIIPFGAVIMYRNIRSLIKFNVASQLIRYQYKIRELGWMISRSRFVCRWLPCFRARFQKRSDHCEKVIGSLISRQLTISRSDRIPRTILLRSDHDPGDPARYVNPCWIRNFIPTIDHFVSNITIVEMNKPLGNIYWNMNCLV